MSAEPQCGAAVTSLARNMIDKLIADLQDPARWMATLDIVTILLVVVLPWSTTAVAILAISLFVLSLPMFDLKGFQRALKTPASITALLFFALGAVGVLWSFDASWPERFHGAGQLVKLLLIPLLLLSFQPFTAWVVGPDCVCRVMLRPACMVVVELAVSLRYRKSWPFRISRRPRQKLHHAKPGIRALRVRACGCCLSADEGWQEVPCIGSCVLLSLAFVANMLFVATARTALVYGPVLLLLFAAWHFDRFAGTLFVAMAVIVAALAWSASPTLRLRVTDIVQEYELYKTENAATSTGQRLEYWRKSLKFISEAPLLGHGTGSTLELFEKDAVGQSGVSAEIIGNPHNQTLNVAVQWGVLGLLALYAM